MITVTPDDNEIILSAASCTQVFAELCGPVNRRLCVVPYEKDSNFVTTKIPTDIPNGIYYIHVRNVVPCGKCIANSKIKVNVKVCQPVTFPVTHEPTFPNMGETIKECCEEDPCKDGR